jgi:hypothetical protein
VLFSSFDALDSLMLLPSDRQAQAACRAKMMSAITKMTISSGTD